MRRPIIFLSFSFVLISFFAQTASACSCRFGGGAPCEEYWQADTVFSGLALSSSRLPVDYGSYKTTRRLVRFTMEESFRGINSNEVEVITGLGGGDCGFQFKHGERYLVYARRDPKTNRLSTSICGRTRSLAEAAEDLQYFRSLPNAPPGGVIFGNVVKRNNAFQEGALPFLPIPGADITIERESEEHSVRSDAQGIFRVSGLKPGSYKVKLKLPPGLTRGDLKDEDAGIVENELKVENFGCAETGFYLESDTRVKGQAVDDTGKPVTSLHLSMRGAAKDKSNVFLSTETDTEGRFEFKTVPPGDYLLGFRITSNPNATSPYPRTYYPGVPLKAQATIITVKEGDTVKNLELRLPPPLATYEVEGTVVWPDGQPAPLSAIYLALNEENDSIPMSSPPTDQFGRFTLKLFEGLDYKVSAFMSRPNRPGFQSPWIDVPAKHGPRSIKLVLPNNSP
jgi:hypothetical protein